MKRLLIGVSLLLSLGGALHAQSDELNLQKYWKLRNDFRDYFIKIGSEFGASIPAKALVPGGCVDNYNPWYAQQVYGSMHWGDGTIYLGHYLTLLATEYRLLKNAGQDLTGVKNELYYALNALNRLDLNAEPKLGDNYNQMNTQTLNGFMLRDDVPENFANANWGSTNFDMRCTDADMYKNNNVMKVDDGAGLDVSTNSRRNNPSADQVQSILVGLSVIHKLVDNDYVKPTASDAGFYLVDETKNITDRIVGFLNDHNWTLIDVNGWPVNNMGGDYIFLAYPTSRAGHRITGNTYTSPILRRFNSLDLNVVETCMTGFGHKETLTQPHACDNIATTEAAVWVGTGGTMHAWPYIARVEIEGLNILTEDDVQDHSAFQSWQAMQGPTVVNPLPSALDILVGQWAPVWDNSFMGSAQQVLEDLDDDGKFNNSFSSAPMLSLAFPLNLIRWKKDNGRSYTRSIIFESGVISGDWSNYTAHNWGDYTDNRELELINYILYDQSPLGSRSLYKNYLDGMSSDGPYNLYYKTFGTDSLAYTSKLSGENGWGADYRWGSGSTDGGSGGELGVFSGLDYMVMHNLYYLLYQSSLPPFQEVDNCFCNPEPHLDYSSYTWTDTIAANLSVDLVNSKTAYIPHCTKDVFQPVSNDVPSGTIFDVKPQFDSYIDLKIFTTKHQTHNTTVEPGAVVNVKTRFDICESNTLLLDKSNLNMEYATTFVEQNAAIECLSAGEVRVKSGATLYLRQRGKLILHGNSKLIIEDGAKLVIEKNASLEYYNGAQIFTEGPNSEIYLYGSIVAKDAAAFTIIPNGTAAGKLYVENEYGGFKADAASTFLLQGKGNSDLFIVIQNQGNLSVTDTDITSFTINNCKVELKEGRAIDMQQPIYSTNVHYFSAEDNTGFSLSDLNTFNNCTFTNVPVTANLNVENTGVFTANTCNFIYNNRNLNLSYVPQVVVLGRGYSFDHCNFNGLYNACLTSGYLTLTSNIFSTNFTNNDGTNVSNTLTGVMDNSDVEIYVKESNFTRCNIGIKKQLGKLSLKCSGFTSNREVNIYAQNSCDLNMSYPSTAGNNSLTATLNGKNIQIENSNVTLSNGLNYIQSVPSYTIFGSLEASCTGFCFARNFSGNQWAANIASPPATSSFQITFSNGPGMTPLLTPLANYETCIVGGGGESGRAAGGKSAGIDSSFVFYSLVRADSVSMADQIATAQAKMSLYADSGVKANDLYAIRLLDELFTIGNVDRSDAYTNSLLWTAYDNMKGAVESAFKHDIITAADNTVSFEDHVGKYVHALMYLSDSVIDSTNFYQQYYLELDKAHLFRLLERPSIAYNMLYELESCGIDSLTQSIVNQWKEQAQTEMVIANIGILALDTVIVVDTSSYLNPSLVVNNYHFGAIINDPNDIQYPNCLYFDTKYLESRNEALSVYPNPASASFFVQWLGSEQATELLIEQGDGKTVLYLKWPDDQPTVKIASESWSPGMYVVHVKDAQGRVHTKKLILN